MSRTKKAIRSSSGKFAERKSNKVLAAWWGSALFSLVIVWLTARAATATLGGFRSCNGDTPVLNVSSCGKQSLTLGDMVLVGLFCLAIFMSFSLITAAWRATRRGAVLK
ncbi:MAG: hypothetical protein ABIV43_02760 [Candidatus Saccharimonadales bacterium]